MDLKWTRFKPWERVSSGEFEDNGWQDRNAITRLAQLKSVIDGAACRFGSIPTFSV